MILDQKITEALLSTIYFENKESIQLFAVPKLREVCIELAREAYAEGGYAGREEVHYNYQFGDSKTFEKFIQDKV